MPSKRVKMADSVVDADYVRAHFWYDPATGFLYRKSTNRPFGTIDQKGHLRGLVKGTGFFAHRLVWLYNYGEWPSATVDHINMNGADNRLSNLRLASYSQNMCNGRVRHDSISKLRGVSFDKRCPNRPWMAWITFEGKSKRLGWYATKEEAHAVRNAAALEIHGEFADVARTLN